MYKTYGHTSTGGTDYKTVQWSSDNATEMLKAERSKSRLENKGYTLYGQEAGLFCCKLFYKKSIN